MYEMIYCIKSNEEAKAIACDLYPCVELRCSCDRSAIAYIPLDKFEAITDTYCVLKDGVTLTCPKCGAVHTNKYIPLETKIKSSWTKCPSCGSFNVEKIPLISKAVSFAVLDVLSPYLAKKYHCKNCGRKF